MSEALTVSEAIAESFGLQAARALTIRPLRNASMCVVHLDQAPRQEGHSVFLPVDDAFLIMLYLIDVDHCDIRSDRSAVPLKTYPKGSMCLISLRAGAAISISGPFDALAIHIPAAHFAELAEEAGEPLIDDLAICRGVEDPVVRNLGAALMPMFDMPDDVRDTLLPHMGLALNAHLAHRYGRSPVQHLAASGRLSPLQEKRIKAFMAANVSRDLTIGDIAEASGFVVSDLCSGFMETTGQSVFDWLMAYRVSRAQSLLVRTGQAMGTIAGDCGFADETAFAGSFARAVGMSPADWRARNRH